MARIFFEHRITEIFVYRRDCLIAAALKQQGWQQRFPRALKNQRQTPSVQRCCRPQRVPQLPQFRLSVAKSAQLTLRPLASRQATVPVGQVKHALLAQCSPLPQVLPQLPQC
jgi:hypothetical protein